MKSLLISIAITLASLPTLAQHPEEDKYRLSRSSTGSHLRETFASSSSTPLDRPYSMFTAAEKAAFRAHYESMPDEDEPPFPADGLAPVVEQMLQLIGTYGLVGEVYMRVAVNEAGKATGFTFLKYPNSNTARAVAYVFTQTVFKPARCGSTACAMEFPFRVTLRTN